MHAELTSGPISAPQMIDHAWGVALDRAQKAGQLLAACLMAGGHGDRPVVLVGYSMGARLIFHCLLELCRHNAKGAPRRPCLYIGACPQPTWGNPRRSCQKNVQQLRH